jgi:flagellar export protein FliJ
MRGLPLLIKLARNGADERRCELGRIMSAHAQAQAALSAHDDFAAHEARVAASGVEARAAYADWLTTARRRRATLAERQAELGRTEDAARTALREAVAEMKKLDAVQRDLAAAERREALRREAVRADELQAMRQPRVA